MPRGANWIKDKKWEEQNSAEKTLKKAKNKREGKIFILIKISDNPLTYKEIEVKT